MITYLASEILPKDEKCSRAILQQHHHFYLDEHGLLYHYRSPTSRNKTTTQSQRVFPRNLRFDILKAFHDNPLGGHLGHDKTYDKVRLHYYWSRMYKDIQHWVRSCIIAKCEKRHAIGKRRL